MGIGDLLFGKWCVECGRMGSYLCENCRVGMNEAELVCPGCGNVSNQGKKHVSCNSYLDGLVCVWEKQGVVRKIVVNVKKKFLFDQVKYLAHTAEAVLERDDYSEFKAIMIKSWWVFVELDKSDYKKQGFDENLIFGKIAYRGKKIIENKEIEKLIKRKRMAIIVCKFDWENGREMQSMARALKDRGFVKVWGFCMTR